MKHAKFLILASLCISCFGNLVWAVPARPEWQMIDQPDGTTIEMRLVGDEFYHYWINLDGQEMIQNEEGFWIVKPEQATAAQRKARRAASTMFKEADEMRKAPVSPLPTNMLVILVNFSDRSLNADHGNAYYTDWLNGENLQPYGSVWEYFNTTSDGQYSPHWDVVGPVTLDSAMAYYGGNDNSGDDLRPQQMAFEACEKADALGCDFSKYDNNNDGTVDNVYIIYAGYAESSCSRTWPNSIWPHSWSMGNYATHTIDGKKVSKYGCSAELDNCSGNTPDGIGTFCHEFSHVIGMPDYYDTSYGENHSNGCTPDTWSLMDHGSYNGNGCRPPLYSIFDKCYMGWASMPPVLPKNANMSISMPVGAKYARHISGTTSAKSYTSTDTVYYLENRQQTGKFDYSLPGHGLVIWQVIYRSSWSTPNNQAGLLRYTLLSATGNTTSLGTKKDSYPGYNKVTTKTVWPGCQLNAIKETNQVITFNFNGGAGAMAKRDESFQIAPGQSYTWRGQVLNKTGIYRDTARTEYGDTAITFTLSYADPAKAIIYTAPKKLAEVTSNTSCGLHTGVFGQKIAQHYFSNGIGLVLFSDTLRSVGNYAFYGCRSGKSNQVNTITLPNTVETIGAYAFYCCYEATRIDIGTSVKTIGNYGMYKCNSLKELTLPETMTSLGTYAMKNCTTLVTLTSKALTPPSCSSNTFENVTKSKVNLRVYPISLSKYKSANVWKEFFLSEIECGQPSIQLTKDTICQGQTYTYRGQQFTTSTIYADSIWSQYGCLDHIYRLELTVTPTYAFENSIATCSGEPYIWHNQSITQSGTYYDKQTSMFGCDSTYTLHLKVLDSPEADTLKMAVCDGEEYNWRGKQITKAGHYIDKQTSVLGCDSVIHHLEFHFNPVYQYTDSAVTDSETPYLWHEQSLTQSGTYYDRQISMFGCDSIYTLELQVVPATPTGMKEKTADNKRQDDTKKYIRNNQLYIERNGLRYDMFGLPLDD